MLARDQFVAAQQAFSAAEVDDDIAEFDPFDEAVDDLAGAVLVFGELARAFGVAHFLHDDLFGGLRGDAAEIDRRQRIDDDTAEFDLRVFALGLGQQHLGVFVFDGLDHRHVAREANFAVLAIDGGADVVLVPVLGAAGFLNRLLHRLEHFLAVNALVAGNRIGHLHQFGTRHANAFSCHRRSPAFAKFVASDPHAWRSLQSICRSSRAWPC